MGIIMRKIIIAIILVLIISSATYLLWYSMFREDWQEGEILNIAGFTTYLPVRLSDPRQRSYIISVYADGTMHMATGVHRDGLWRNSLELGRIVNRAWPYLNDRGYWQKIWRGSVRLEVVLWEARVQLSEEDFERIKELILAVDENELSGRYSFEHSDVYLIITRQTRYYAYSGGDERISALHDDLLRLMPIYFD